MIRMPHNWLTLAGTLLPLLLLSALPGQVQAACGDYLHVGADDMKAAPEAPLTAPVKPCDGPGCSQRPQAPVVPAPAPLTISGQEWLNSVSPPFHDAPEPRAGWLDWPSSPIPVRSATTIFHPPR